jgi:hypothetical protein
MAPVESGFGERVSDLLSLSCGPRQRSAVRLGVLLIVAFAFTHGALFWGFTVEDAYISFRYARNFVQGHGLVFNPGERVEGYTNFL